MLSISTSSPAATPRSASKCTWPMPGRHVAVAHAGDPDVVAGGPAARELQHRAGEVRVGEVLEHGTPPARRRCAGPPSRAASAGRARRASAAMTGSTTVVLCCNRASHERLRSGSRRGSRARSRSRRSTSGSHLTMWSKSTAQIVVYCREIRSASNHARGGKPMRVTSASASRSSAVRPAYMSPLPPGSTASTICGNLSRRTRMACACTAQIRRQAHRRRVDVRHRAVPHAAGVLDARHRAVPAAAAAEHVAVGPVLAVHLRRQHARVRRHRRARAEARDGGVLTGQRAPQQTEVGLHEVRAVRDRELDVSDVEPFGRRVLRAGHGRDRMEEPSLVAARLGEVHGEAAVAAVEAAVDVAVTDRLVAPLVEVDVRILEQRVRRDPSADRLQASRRDLPSLRSCADSTPTAVSSAVPRDRSRRSGHEGRVKLLEDKVAIVTGAGSASAAESPSRWPGPHVRGHVEPHGVEVREPWSQRSRPPAERPPPCKCDVRLQEDVDGCVLARSTRTADRHPRERRRRPALDVAFLDLTDEVVEASWQTGILGTVRCMQACVPHMLERGKGAVVNVASGAGLLAPVGMAAYSAAQEAIRSLTRTAAVELGPLGIRVNVICPVASGSSRSTGGWSAIPSGSPHTSRTRRCDGLATRSTTSVRVWSSCAARRAATSPGRH